MGNKIKTNRGIEIMGDEKKTDYYLKYVLLNLEVERNALISHYEIKQTRCKEIKAILQLHDMGLIRYNKLTQENYYFWWYETKDKENINKFIFTCDLNDFSITRKGKLFINLIKLCDNKLLDIENLFYGFTEHMITEREFYNKLNYKKRQLIQLGFNF